MQSALPYATETPPWILHGCLTRWIKNISTKSITVGQPSWKLHSRRNAWLSDLTRNWIIVTICKRKKDWKDASQNVGSVISGMYPCSSFSPYASVLNLGLSYNKPLFPSAENTRVLVAGFWKNHSWYCRVSGKYRCTSGPPTQGQIYLITWGPPQSFF